MQGHVNVKDFLMFSYFEYHCSPTNIKNNNSGLYWKDLDGYFQIGMSVVLLLALSVKFGLFGLQ
jgi:hypothetical protein